MTPSCEDRLDRGLGRHGVEVRAEEERRAAVGRAHPRVEVPGRRADPSAGVVLAHLEAEVADVRGDPVGDLALLTGRAGQRCKLGEERDDVAVGHGPILGR